MDQKPKGFTLSMVSLPDFNLRRGKKTNHNGSKHSDFSAAYGHRTVQAGTSVNDECSSLRVPMLIGICLAQSFVVGDGLTIQDYI